jgi:NADH dehydrogenase
VIALGSPAARFQPVYVGDVAKAYLAALDDRDAAGKRYDLCGTREFTLRELMEFVCAVTGKKRLVIGLPDRASYLQAWFMELMPFKLLTRDNYYSMKVPNVCSGPFPFGIQPAALEAMAPAWLTPASPRERYPLLRWRAGR